MMAKRNWRSFPYWHETILALMLVGLLIAAGVIDRAFLSIEVQRGLSGDLWGIALLALPMTLIIITAGIDLSVGSAVALCAVVLGLTYEQGLAPGFGAGLAVLAGVAAGALNGWFVAYLRVHPLIVTLATLAAFRGIAEGISLARPISGFPESFTFIGRDNWLGFPIPGYLFVVLAMVAAVVLRKTPLGRSVYAIGHNETAARFSGIPVARIQMLLYTLAGACSGLAAVILVARHNTAKADLAKGLELEVITAVVLGGTSIFGGRGSILGTLLGVLLIHETREFVRWNWQREELLPVVIGTLLIVSVLMHKALSPRGKEEA
jgi:rhamnose transport system permease protein